MKAISLRAKLTIWYTALFTFTVLAFAGAAQVWRSRALLKQFDDELRDELRWTEIFLSETDKGSARSKRHAGAALEARVRENIEQHFMLNKATHVLEIRNREMKLVYRSLLPADSLSQLFTIGQPLQQPVTVSYRGHDFRVLQKQAAPYWIGVAVSLRPLYEVQQQLLRTFAWLFPLAMSVALGGGWLLAKYSMRPVSRVIQAARQITATNLSRRLPSYPAQDEIGALVETMNEMIARLESGVARIEQFSQDAAHELRTPLTILRGEMELALTNNAGATELRRVMVSALEEISRTAKIVESLLFLAHADAGKMALSKESVALHELATEVFEDAQALAEGRPLQLSLSAPEPVAVLGDASRLRRLLLNLVENAIKFTPEGKVEISLRRADRSAVLTVRDTGIGIPPEHCAHIFERFYRVDSGRSRETGGCGLGLAICAAIAHAHDGEIRVQSPAVPADHAMPGAAPGTLFEVNLPLMEKSSA